MKLELGKQVAKQMVMAKLTVPDEHPIITSECTDREKWIIKIDNCTSLEEIIDLIKPKYKLRFLKFLFENENITYKDIGNLIIYCWDYIGSLRFNLYFSKEMFLRFLVNADCKKFMTDEDFNTLLSLPDIITVYRGGTNSSKKGMCWTLNKEIAKKYANKYKGVVYQAQIPKNYVLAYMKKDETIILHYRRLENLMLE